MTPKQLIQSWVDTLNSGDPDALADFYHHDAINHQVALEPIEGKAAIHAQFQREMSATKMVCIPENIFEDGEWAMLEWRDPKGLRGCGFFHVVEGKIKFQRGYWDKMSLMKLHGLPEEAFG